MPNGIISGMPMSDSNLPEWEHLLSAAAHLQQILAGATLVGGTAAAIYAQHRVSHDADHVLPDLRLRFDEVLAQLESVAGWRTARVNRPVMILGSLDGIETGVRQLIRDQPLETQEVAIGGVRLRVPTEAEMLRIKAVLVLKRNATRDYLDFAAIAERIGSKKVKESRMTLRIAVIAVLCIGLCCCSFSTLSNQAYAQSRNAAAANKAVMPQITVLNPMGTPPPIQLKLPAPRLDTLDGKTIYFVNTGYIGTDRLMGVMVDWFKANNPKTNVEYRVSKGGMAGVDRDLWAEIGQKGDAAILGLGH
jgi:hypothetical protein